MVIPRKIHTKNYTSKFNFEKKKLSIPERVLDSVSKSENEHFAMSDGIFFFWCKRKIIIVFFGVKFTGDYRKVAIIPTLFRDRRQESKKPNFSLFFEF